MAIITNTEMLRRLRTLIPNGWFGDVAPIRDIVLGGVADALTWVRAQGQVVRAGTRRAGTTGWLLDTDAFGFFGSAFLRRPNESDDAWRKRYTDEIFRLRVTRAAIDKALFDLTGRHPIIVEPWNANDCGAYDIGALGYAGSDFAPVQAAGYDVTGAYDIGVTSYDPLSGPSGRSYPGLGCWGSLELPYQLFVTAFRPLGGGIPNASGTDTGVQSYDTGTFRYTDQSEVRSTVSDAEILACVARTAAAGVIAWTAISN